MKTLVVLLIIAVSVLAIGIFIGKGLKYCGRFDGKMLPLTKAGETPESGRLRDGTHPRKSTLVE